MQVRALEVKVYRRPSVWILFLVLFLHQRAVAEELLQASRLARLAEGMNRLESEMSCLERPASFVRSIVRNLKRDPGNMTFGVLEVETPEGNLVLKVYSSYYALHKLAPSILMNQLLGKLGLAPRIHGILVEREVAKIEGLFQHTGGTCGSGHGFGLLMGKIDDAWNYLRSGRIPPSILTWDADTIGRKIEEIEAACDFYRMYAGDLQFLISGSGQVYLFDMDKFWWVSPANKLYGNGAELYQEELDKLPAPVEVKNDFSNTVRIFNNRVREARSASQEQARPPEGPASP